MHDESPRRRTPNPAQASARLSTVVGSTVFDNLEREAFRTEALEVLPSEWQSLAIEPDLLREMDDWDGEEAL